MTALLSEAIEFATKAHAGQTRKFSGEPYINHPLRVYERVKSYNGNTDEQLAAILHDVLEDTTATYDEIEERFGEDVAILVVELTNPYVASPDKNIRSMFMMEHWEDMSEEAAFVKLCDRIDNLNDIPHDQLNTYWATGYAFNGLIMRHIFQGVHFQAECDLLKAVNRIRDNK
jgi:(p)ppGpp synthase/HD superfamily hydrolase